MVWRGQAPGKAICTSPRNPPADCGWSVHWRGILPALPNTKHVLNFSGSLPVWGNSRSPWSQLGPLPLTRLKWRPDLNPCSWGPRSLLFPSGPEFLLPCASLSPSLISLSLLPWETLYILCLAFFLAAPELCSPPPFCGLNGKCSGGWCPLLSPDLFWAQSVSSPLSAPPSPRKRDHVSLPSTEVEASLPSHVDLLLQRITQVFLQTNIFPCWTGK